MATLKPDIEELNKDGRHTTLVISSTGLLFV